MADAIRNVITRPLYRHQFYAIVALVYNVGVSAFKKSRMLKALNAGDFYTMYNEWNWGCNRSIAIPGLCNRRTAEKRLFSQNRYPWDPW